VAALDAPGVGFHSERLRRRRIVMMAEPTARPLLTSVEPCAERNELLDGEKDQLLADAMRPRASRQ